MANREGFLILNILREDYGTTSKNIKNLIGMNIDSNYSIRYCKTSNIVKNSSKDKDRNKNDNEINNKYKNI